MGFSDTDTPVCEVRFAGPAAGRGCRIITMRLEQRIWRPVGLQQRHLSGPKYFSPLGLCTQLILSYSHFVEFDPRTGGLNANLTSLSADRGYRRGRWGKRHRHDPGHGGLAEPAGRAGPSLSQVGLRVRQPAFRAAQHHRVDHQLPLQHHFRSDGRGKLAVRGSLPSPLGPLSLPAAGGYSSVGVIPQIIDDALPIISQLGYNGSDYLQAISTELYAAGYYLSQGTWDAVGELLSLDITGALDTFVGAFIQAGSALITGAGYVLTGVINRATAVLRPWSRWCRCCSSRL